jgi:hypothetical protein
MISRDYGNNQQSIATSPPALPRRIVISEIPVDRSDLFTGTRSIVIAHGEDTAGFA